MVVQKVAYFCKLVKLVHVIDVFNYGQLIVGICFINISYWRIQWFIGDSTSSLLNQIKWTLKTWRKINQQYHKERLNRVRKGCYDYLASSTKCWSQRSLILVPWFSILDVDYVSLVGQAEYSLRFRLWFLSDCCLRYINSLPNSSIYFFGDCSLQNANIVISRIFTDSIFILNKVTEFTKVTLFFSGGWGPCFPSTAWSGTRLPMSLRILLVLPSAATTFGLPSSIQSQIIKW